MPAAHSAQEASEHGQASGPQAAPSVLTAAEGNSEEGTNGVSTLSTWEEEERTMSTSEEEERVISTEEEEKAERLKHRGASKRKLSALKPLPKLLSPLDVSVCARACVHVCMVIDVEMSVSECVRA